VSIDNSVIKQPIIKRIQIRNTFCIDVVYYQVL